MDFWWIFSSKLRAKLTKKSILIGNTERSDRSKSGQHLDVIFNGFGRPTWVQDPPKTRPKSKKIDERWTSKSMKIWYAF